ncbi:MAG: hypothetical protein SGI97_00285 [candidate division Zixibacteria bacterium]|nr:hypothetical protein [candidate division Zixibacteria bacterium]
MTSQSIAQSIPEKPVWHFITPVAKIPFRSYYVAVNDKRRETTIKLTAEVTCAG